MSASQPFVITVVIPCYKVKERVLGVISALSPDVSHIFCVDDACPEKSGAFIKENCNDKRVQVLFHEKNRGVGGAMVTGYKAALAAKADVVVKVDGDGQMDPTLVPFFVDPIRKGLCDYSKGNRFFRPDDLRSMPTIRLLGNGILSFMTKLSSGYWDIFDPANGYTAIHASVLRELPLDKIDPSYFFESDMLFRLNILRAVVRDVPMRAVYGGETSNLYIRRIVWSFMGKHVRNFFKRIFYNYYLHDFQIASLELFFGALFLAFGTLWSVDKWHYSATHEIEASTGTVMIGVLPIVLGFQMLMSFLQFDITSVPKNPMHQNLADAR